MTGSGVLQTSSGEEVLQPQSQPADCNNFCGLFDRQTLKAKRHCHKRVGKPSVISISRRAIKFD